MKTRIATAPEKTRRNARAACAVRGRVLGRHGYVPGLVHNLSVGGLFFAGRNLSVSEQAELEFELSDSTWIKATCQVLYRKRHGDDAGIGVRFLVLDSTAVGEIARFLASHEVMEASPAVTRALRELPLEEPKATP